jgi:hypothetical protein
MSVIAKENKDLCPSEVGDLAGLFISSDPALITRARSAIGTGQPGRACRDPTLLVEKKAL